MSKFLGGSDVGFAIPHLGVFVGPNLTPDKATGLGNWTAAQIITAITTGMTPQGRKLAPSMPYDAYKNLTKSDARAIAAYLQSLPPVSHQVPGPFGPNETPTSFVMTIVPGSVYAHMMNPPPPAAALLLRQRRPPARHAGRLNNGQGQISKFRRPRTWYHRPSNLLLLPPASAAIVVASKPSTPAIWPTGSNSAMSKG